MTELQQGTLIKDRYQLKEYKGSGSFGEVWLAHDDFLDIEVAIKVYISLDTSGVEEFKTEYKTAYGLTHPNLLAATYFDVWQQRPFLVMKYCSNGSAGNMAGNTSEREIWKFIRDVAAGLAYLHAQDPEPIVHQDIKPDNILIDERGTYLITDFGISKKIRSTMRKQSKRGVAAGAAAYMGPERFSKEPTPIMASDVWSLGASIYELATGELPFCGMGGGMLMNGAELPELDSSKWSKELNAVMQACLAKETWDRPKAQELTEYAAGIMVGAKPVLKPKSFPDPDAEYLRNPELTYDRNSFPTTRKRQKYKFFIAGIAVLALILGGYLRLTAFFAKDDAKANLNHYEQLVSECYQLTDEGNNSNTDALINAKEKLREITELENKYASEMTEYNRSGKLKNALNPKIDEAHKAWARAAKSQYEKVGDVAKAIEYYKIALRLKENDSIQFQLRFLEDTEVADSVAVVAY